MAQSLSAAVFSVPHGPPALRRRHVVLLAAIPAKTSVPRPISSRRSFLFVGGAPPKSGAGTGKPSTGDGGTPTDPAGISAQMNLAGLPLPSTPDWLRWLLGFVFAVAIPFYGRFRSIERGVETAAEVAEGVAKATKKVAQDIAQALPEDESLKKVVLEVEEIADAVIADAEEAKSIIHKVEEITGEVEAVAEPIIKELEAQEKEGK